MEVVIKQGELREKRVTYQADVPLSLKCRKCKSQVVLMMQVDDNEALIRDQRPEGNGVRVWPHDALVVNVYLCTVCGSMRATWNQG